MTTLEAAGCGIATVGTEVGVLSELGGGVRTVPVAEPGALAAAMLAVLSDPAQPATMGRLGHRAVQDSYTLEQCTGRFLDLYRELVRGREPRQER
jgi:glycosyltransferase involved in cell wall biosynthesis